MGIFPADTNGVIVWSQDVLSMEVGVCFAWLKKGGQNVNDHGRQVLDGSLDSHLLRVVQGCSTAMLDC